MAGLVLAGTVASAQSDAPGALTPSPAAVTTTTSAQTPPVETAVPRADTARPGGRAGRAGDGRGPDRSPDHSPADPQTAAQAKAQTAAKAKVEKARAAAAAQARKTAAAKKAAAAPEAAAPQTWGVTKVVDGDTVVTSEGRVRLLGMDTPERGQCGFGPASSAACAAYRPPAGQGLGRRRRPRPLRPAAALCVRRRHRRGPAQILPARRRPLRLARRLRPPPARNAYVAANAANPNPACEQASSGEPSRAAAPPVVPPAAWPLAGDRHPCPQSRPVKGNEDSMIAHEPGDRYYGVTQPRAVLRLDELGRRGRLPPRQGLTELFESPPSTGTDDAVS